LFNIGLSGKRLLRQPLNNPENKHQIPGSC
jgi:hypothetical protein